MLRTVLVLVACGVVSACSSGAPSGGAGSGGGGGGGAGGSGGGAPPTCGDVCAHVQSVCGSAPGTCVSACDAWSAELRSCVGAAASCGSIDDCAAADGGTGSGSSGGTSSGSGSSSGASSGGTTDAGAAAACGKPGDPCTQDTDCQGASGYGCADNETFIPKQPQLCDSGQCHDWQAECTSVCSSMGTTCAGVLYAACSH